MYNFLFYNLPGSSRKSNLRKTADKVGGFTAKFCMFYTFKCGQKIGFKCVDYRKCDEFSRG